MKEYQVHMIFEELSNLSFKYFDSKIKEFIILIFLCKKYNVGIGNLYTDANLKTKRSEINDMFESIITSTYLSSNLDIKFKLSA